MYFPCIRRNLGVNVNRTTMQTQSFLGGQDMLRAHFTKKFTHCSLNSVSTYKTCDEHANVCREKKKETVFGIDKILINFVAIIRICLLKKTY
ncbi:hypothetical protein PUN28_003413 [Cardiocondyla obscurior]|uniref:Uncharacterized protein n=1 Tax=Cardiocondyla obscurior TaxID=286306 RepID=A0AAW2GNU0_9HYME